MSGRTLLFVACLNRKVPYFPAARGNGIAVFSFNQATGALTKLSDETGADNPNYLAIHESNRCIYAVSDVAGQNEGAIIAYQFNPATGRLGYINKQGTLGSLPAYASLDQTGKFLLIANYSIAAATPDGSPDQAIAVMPIRTDGGVGTPVTSRAHSGSGPNAQRQERSHAHCIRATPDNRHVVVADLGIDKLMTYRFDGNLGDLTPGEAPFLDLPPGSGPRHFAFHPSARFAYVINELDASTATLSFDEFSGRFQLLHVVPMLPTDYREVSECADLQIIRRALSLRIESRPQQYCYSRRQPVHRSADVGRSSIDARRDTTQLRDRPLEPISGRRQPERRFPDRVPN